MKYVLHQTVRPWHDPVVVPHSCGEECNKKQRSAPRVLHPCPPSALHDATLGRAPTAQSAHHLQHAVAAQPIHFCGGIDPKLPAITVGKQPPVGPMHGPAITALCPLQCKSMSCVCKRLPRAFLVVPRCLISRTVRQDTATGTTCRCLPQCNTSLNVTPPSSSCCVGNNHSPLLAPPVWIRSQPVVLLWKMLTCTGEHTCPNQLKVPVELHETRHNWLSLPSSQAKVGPKTDSVPLPKKKRDFRNMSVK